MNQMKISLKAKERLAWGNIDLSQISHLKRQSRQQGTANL
jgi:hypothetical protein